jgi:hypothetical protein
LKQEGGTAMTLNDVYIAKIEEANSYIVYLTQFIFEYKGECYYVKWEKLKWSEPIKIEVL